MGTNYYLHSSACVTCKRSEDVLHIGKSSGGWHFALHIYPEDGINNLEDWIAKFISMSHWIQDEYGKVVSIEKMLNTIMNRKGGKCGSRDDDDQWYKDNCAERGYNDLAKHKIEQGHCTAWSIGTWDLLVSDFS